jgi:hypothetical protein
MLTLPEVFFEPNVRGSWRAWRTRCGEIESAGPFPDVPLRVVTGGLDAAGRR